MSARVQGRIFWIDGLRAVVVIGIALFHSALVFSPGSWLVNNPERSLILGAFAGFTFQWGIALLFLVAGCGTWFGLRSSGALKFARLRTVRLGVPLVIGLALLSPLQSYVQHASTLRWDGLLRTYLTFWTSVHPALRPSSAYDYVFHLWFLTHLLAISLLTLPVAVFLRSTRGLALTRATVPWIEAPGGFLLGALPIAAAQMALHAMYPLYQDWSDLVAWAMLYLEGFVLMADARFERAIRRRLGAAVLAGLLMIGVTNLMLVTGQTARWDAHPDYSPGYLAYQAMSAANTWIWVVVLLASGMRWLSSDSVFTRWGVDRPLPFYVLSHPIIVVLARFVVALDAGVWIKFTAIAGGSIAVTLALCEIVSRYRVLRVAFGLGAAPRPRHAPARAS